jgi:hypothetical protein
MFNRIVCLTSCAVLALLSAASEGLAQKSTIDLESYRENSAYAYAERTYEVGTHSYTVVNIKPKDAGDTTCISALVIDKRKYVMVDLGNADAPHGMIVPEKQPIDSGLVIIMASPIEAKTFLILPNGKVVTLPGDQIVVDKPGSTVYVVWDNAGSHMLTVFDYERMRLLINSKPIPQPKKWYTDGMVYSFSVEGKEDYRLIDLFTKSVTTVPSEKQLQPAEHIVDASSVKPSSCCSAETMKASE